jgi:hypothetical protein
MVDRSADLLAQLGGVSMYLDEACDWSVADGPQSNRSML